MRRFIVVVILVYICFVIESALSNGLGRWFKPDLMIILIVFFNLFRGVRTSLLVAFLGGLLKDSFAVEVFGMHIFSYMVSAYLTSIVKMYIYQPGSRASRLLMVCLVYLIYITIQYFLYEMFFSMDFREVFFNVFIPEMLATSLVTLYVLEKLRQCVSRLFA